MSPRRLRWRIRPARHVLKRGWHVAGQVVADTSTVHCRYVATGLPRSGPPVPLGAHVSDHTAKTAVARWAYSGGAA